MQEAEQTAHWLATMRACVEGVSGEIEARARAGVLAELYRGLEREERRRFLYLLATNFGPDDAAIARATDAFSASADGPSRPEATRRLRTALEPLQRRLFIRLNGVRDGMRLLVGLRADLLPLGRSDPHLRALDDELEDLLRGWFDFGFLQLQRITWGSPADLLEKLIRYEAVHAIGSWDDLRNRLDSDRCCYALFHPSLPGEPLAFTEVALTRGLPGSVQALLDQQAPLEDPTAADTAAFYSISSCQRGMQGVSFGEYLIRRVISELRRDLPQIRTWATLSPIPGFRLWLEGRLGRLRPEGSPKRSPTRTAAVPAAGRDLLAIIDDPTWTADDARRERVSPRLLRLCARYFTERRADGSPLDPVARFHLRNGARLERLCFLGDVSRKGLRQSFGIMVNYQYDRELIEANQAAYETRRELAIAPTLIALAREAETDLTPAGSGRTA